MLLSFMCLGFSKAADSMLNFDNLQYSHLFWLSLWSWKSLPSPAWFISLQKLPSALSISPYNIIF